jgi:hypothetical protein
MPNVLEEVTDQQIDRDHIMRRVDDWAARIDALYRQIGGWLPDGWTSDHSNTIRMHEELMQKYRVPPRDLPVLRLLFQGTLAGRIEPRGLWIIGENGRLDFFRGDNHYLIVDTAENFAPPDWHIARFIDRRKLQRLSQNSFATVLDR